MVHSRPRLPWARSTFAVPPSKMSDWGGLNEKDLCQGAGGVDGPPLESKRAHLASRAGGAAAEVVADGGVPGRGGGEGLQGSFPFGRRRAAGPGGPPWHAGVGP